jgi:hypothetical protein
MIRSMPARLLLVCGLVAVTIAVFASAGPALLAAADTLPSKLTDAEFWRLSEDLSEPNGFFRSDNLLSNEIFYPTIMADLVRQVKPGSVYVGVGPEQNFNYLAAIRPKMVFIADIRRGNLQAQLMYKALFEMASDRADFVSRLFTKKRPDGLSGKSSATDIIDAFWDVPTSAESVYKQNLQALDDYLTKSPHHLPLSKEDLDGIEYVYYSFYWFGPSINYNSSTNGNSGRPFGNMADYAQLMKARDDNGAERSYLSTDETFAFLKDLESRNLIVPAVGNFGGPKTLRAIGKYVRDHGTTIGAFYLSNVEQYLRQDNIWGNFCANVASMPLDDQSTFIRSGQGGFGFGGGGLRNSLGSMKDETQNCGAAN